ncbi:MAG: gamma-glutamyltransferase, partial [Acidimicrobiaceae bacterium]|nr:gamma-glutamyltransferase [Acidimicrobiaceae bacterium]
MRTTRPVCLAERGMVATAHYLGTAAALDILKEGGTAVDAALCAAATLGVVLPHMVGIGGDAFWLIYDARHKTLSAINGSGPSGGAVTRDQYKGMSAIPFRGPRSAITVPGAVDSWRLAYERMGTMPWARLLEPAIHYATTGVAVTNDLAHWIADDVTPFRQDPGSTGIFLRDGQPLQAGERLCQEALGKTLKGIARHGPRHFYDDTGDSIARYLASRGGVLKPEDFRDYEARWVAPLTSHYRDCTVAQVPLPSQGIAGQLILNFLDGVDLKASGPEHPDYYHALIQSIKWAFQKRDAHWADPGFHVVPVEALLDPALAARERSHWLDHPEFTHANRPGGSDTTFMSVADRYGNAVGLVQSLYFDFGSCVTDPESGVLLQNRGSFFSLDPHHPNALEPHKQSASTLMSGMLFKAGKPYLVYGTQGGEVQPQTQTSLVTRIVDFGFDVQEAIEAPRVLYGRSWGDDANRLLLESSAPPGVFEAMRAKADPV